ncbi:30S ribosomal protein S6 [Patescibacteria group bacterium]|uniref:Small ribosomal subunit protein bS6 n=1 Tax=candidate division WWE3 bacterium TaxID=2053526 RepID=A0A928TQA0_UNCKA|nr:30S ribosomal protein S6 [candidate division WWE3 bacterium]MCL4732832.1 30S ribosomal protein S6 [Patescibacteria group bacterium]
MRNIPYARPTSKHKRPSIFRLRPVCSRTSARGFQGDVPKDMREYELLYIVPTSFTEEELGNVEKNVSAILEKNAATVVKTLRLGKLRFAYPIKHETYGHYVLLRFQSEPGAVIGVSEGLRLIPKEVLRYIILNAEEAGGEFRLVQFQPVVVEDKRKMRPRKGAPTKQESPEKEREEQKAGVAALEGSKEVRPAEAEAKLEQLSAEDLQKKIDEALDEKA